MTAANGWTARARARLRRAWRALRRRASAGARGERCAARWLRRRGHRILARNVRIAGVEVDLLVEARDGTLAIVEVKRRRTCDERERPVRARQRARLRRAARAVAGRHPGRRVRIDLLLVLGEVGSLAFEHRPGALGR